MHGSGPVSFNFKIQVGDQKAGFGSNQLLIENASTTWDTANKKEVDSYENVARLIIRTPRETNTKVAKAACEKLAFTPWHSLAAHQPVGGTNRLQRSVYYNSATHRGAKTQ